MKSALVHRVTTWLCLALVFLVGVTPAQGFVLCIEADGCVSVELKSVDGACGSCEGHEEAGAPLETAPMSNEDESCPCLDIPIPGSVEEDLVRSRSIEVHVATWFAPPAEVLIHHATLLVMTRRGPPPFIPRVASSLAHLRCVVLLV